MLLVEGQETALLLGKESSVRKAILLMEVEEDQSGERGRGEKEERGRGAAQGSAGCDTKLTEWLRPGISNALSVEHRAHPLLCVPGRFAVWMDIGTR